MVTSLSGVSNINFTALNDNAFADSLSQNSSSALSFKASTLDAPSAPISPALKNSSSLSLPDLFPMKSFVLPELSASPATKTGMVAAPSLPASTSTQPVTELAQFWGPPRLLDNLAGPFNTLEGARDAGRAWVDEYEQGTEGGYGYVSLLVSTESNTTWGETRTTYYASEPIQSDQRFTELSRQGLQKVINDVYGYDTYKYEGLDPGSE